VTKQIWIPEAKVKVTVVDGTVKVWHEITMHEKAVSPTTGFQSEDKQ
jgi:hypothetical protein